MRGGSHGNWNRFLCSQILGAERDTVLPGGRHPVRFVFQSDQDYSGRDAPWRRCCCGGGEPRGTAHAGLEPCLATTGTVGPGAGCTFEARRLRRAPTSTGGPEAHGAFRALWECVGLGGPEIPMAEGCTAGSY